MINRPENDRAILPSDGAVNRSNGSSPAKSAPRRFATGFRRFATGSESKDESLSDAKSDNRSESTENEGGEP
jgi:hypothetical protein